MMPILSKWSQKCLNRHFQVFAVKLVGQSIESVKSVSQSAKSVWNRGTVEEWNRGAVEERDSGTVE